MDRPSQSGTLVVKVAIRWRGLVVLASCVFLAWSLQRAVHRLLPVDAPEATTVVRVPALAAKKPEAHGHDVWLLSVVVDGRLVPWAELERTGDWKLKTWGLGHVGEEPATLRIRGRHVLLSFLTSPWSTVVRVDGPEGRGRDFDLFHPERSETTILLVDLAGGQVVSEERSDEQNPWKAAWTLVPLLLIALLVRPWKSAAALELWVVAVVALLHLLVWLTQGVGYNSDAPGYVRGFRGFADGAESYYPPGYALFLAPCQSLFPGATGLAVTGVQHLLMVVTLFWLQRIARAFVPEELAIAALLLAGSMAPTLLLPQVAFSENVALVGMAGALWLASRRAGKGALVRDLLAGILVGWAALARILPLACVALPVLLLHTVEHGFGWRAFVRTGRVLSLGVIALVLAGGWIWHRSGEFSISNGQGLHLYDRVVKEQGLLDRDAPATKRFLEIVGNRDLTGLGHWDVTPMLDERGLDYAERTRLMGDVAREGIRSQPWPFARHTFAMAWQEYEADPLPHVPYWASEDVPVPSLENEPLLGIWSSSALWRRDLDAIYASLWPALLWAPVAGLALLPFLRGRRTFLALLIVPVVYLLGCSSVEHFVERYVVGVLPFALILVPAPFAALLEIGRRIRGGRRSSDPAAA